VEIYFQESGLFGKWCMSAKAQESSILTKLTRACELRSVELVQQELELW